MIMARDWARDHLLLLSSNLCVGTGGRVGKYNRLEMANVMWIFCDVSNSIQAVSPCYFCCQLMVCLEVPQFDSLIVHLEGWNLIDHGGQFFC